MVIKLGQSQALTLRGEVVEILEQQGQRLAKIAVKPRNILDVAAENIADAHLGDTVLINALITVGSIKQDIAGETDPFEPSAPSDPESNDPYSTTQGDQHER